ncbi:DUF58 domain-containing protein [Priestia taiwanensis]|uniref:DUF58 domain-containing protein n=1 Tax=Priestia taiwanensis TaxID=1347902 RepID=A0A917AQI7_9BACI|nr:DUF58 domain-containing protein [Priestia taiwanensis]MBM7363171.1 uncharacterized protein (DUF58 family) [Priestia taiwanensis]GGE68266.1 hypothetical protein GCM10007140_17910 [Priestia taiwanensis]
MIDKPVAMYHGSMQIFTQMVMPFLLFCAIFLKWNFLIGIAICYYLFVLCTHLYLQYIVRYVYVTNKKKSVHLFPGEDGELSLQVVNGSPVPIVNAKYSFHLDASISVGNKEYERYMSLGQMYSSSFIQKPNRCNEYAVPLSVSQRGVYKLERVSLMVNDIFGVATVYYPSIPSLSSEIVVFPMLKVVQNVHLLQQDVYGVDATSRSIYYDESAVVGTKKYERESFRHIHWKATARLGELQAKQFQPVYNKRFSVILCLTDSKWKCIQPNVEELISYTAFICEYLTKQKITYEVFISIDKGNRPFHLPMGGGNIHFAHVLEALARIKNNFSLLLTSPFLTECAKHGEQNSTYVIIGAHEEECRGWTYPYYTVNQLGQLMRGGGR